MNQYNEVCKQVAGQLVRAKEDILKDAIAHALGRSTWELYEVADRGYFEKLGMDGAEVFVFDDRPMVRFTPVVFDVEDPSSFSIQASFTYEVLYEK